MRYEKINLLIILLLVIIINPFNYVEAKTIDNIDPEILVSGYYEYTIEDNKEVRIYKYNGSDSYVYVPSELDGYLVTSIGSKAFYDCEDIVAIEMPKTIKSIGDFAFNKCKKLELISLPSELVLIGESAFEECDSLTAITIPEKLTSIGARAFAICKNFTSITFLNSKLSIGDDAFYDCKNLVVTAENDSYVYNYCIKNKIKFIDIDDCY